MDAYIQSLEPNMSSTTTWMRTRIPLVENRKQLKGLGELLSHRLKDLSSAKASIIAVAVIGREMMKLRDKVRTWVDVMEELEYWWAGRIERSEK